MINKNIHYWTHLQNILFYIVFFIIVLVLGYFSQIYSVQYDWTVGNRNTLTKTTQSLLKELDDPLIFKVFIPDNEVALKVNIKKRIKKYQQFKKDTSVEFINPDLHPDLTRLEGIKSSGQVVVKLGKRSEIVNTLSEKHLVNVLYRLSRKEPRLVVFLEGHEERRFDQNKSSGMSQLAEALSLKGFDFQAHHLIRTQSIPKNASFLVIASPQKALTKGEVDIIVNYVKQGGNLLWLHEPGDLMNLNPLADELGIIIPEGTLVDANKELREMLGIQHPAVIPVVDYGNSELAKGIRGQTIFPFATAIIRDREVTNDWLYDSLLSTLPSSWLEVGKIAGNVRFNTEDGDLKGPLTLGLSMSRTLAGKGNNTDINQRIVVIGDSDFMLNAFVGHADNLVLSLAIYNWLAEDENLVGIDMTKATDIKLDLSPNLLYSIGVFFLIVFPLLLLFLGLYIWQRRRTS